MCWDGGSYLGGGRGDPTQNDEQEETCNEEISDTDKASLRPALSRDPGARIHLIRDFDPDRVDRS